MTQNITPKITPKITQRILDIVDMQNDFMDPKGALYVTDAEKIIPAANAFLKDVDTDEFKCTLLKFDTHFFETYSKNPESEQFPEHCMYDTWGWKLAIDVPQDLQVKTPVYTMTKNVFNMWAGRPDMTGVTFKTRFNKQAYKDLFKINKKSRDQFMQDMNIGPQTEVVMMGVASDYCVHDAMVGYLERGAKVTVLSDLVKGIGTDVPGRALSGDINDVLKLDVFKKYVANGQLSVMTSQAYKAKIKLEKSTPTQGKNYVRKP